MSTTKTYTVWCDEPECFAWTVASGTAHTASVVRREAKREGWVFRKGPGVQMFRDYCPHHARTTAP